MAAGIGKKVKVPREKSYFPYAIVIGLGAALVVLAVLQYRWSDQVSQAERDRMEASLRIATTQFRQEFSRELQTLCSGLQPDPELLADKDWDGYAVQSADWLKNSASPELISALYVWRPDEPLLQLDRTNKNFKAAEKPPWLQPVFERIQQQAENGRQGRSFRPMAWSMDGNIPALYHGLYLFHDPEGRRSGNSLTLAGFTIIVLNREFIQAKLLPDLATRHFGGPEGFLYQVAIFNAGDPDHPVYQSGAALKKRDVAAADVAVDLLDVRPRPPDRPSGGPPPPGGGQFFGGIRGGPPRGGPGGPPPDQQQRSPNSPGSPPLNASSRNAFAYQERLRLARRLGVAAPFPSLIGDARSSWQLVVRHRAGSVDAAASDLRMRNLGISFAILLLLGASMALIIITTQRAQRLARLQVEFVAGVSHELRTPLAVISSASENLTDGIVEGKGQVKLYGTLIRNEARRLEGMMEHILEFASGQKRRIYDPRLLSVDDLIDRAISFCSASIQDAQFTVEKHIAPGLPQVLAEEHGLLQCLQNLITNAVKYGGEKRWIGIDARMDGASILISVADRGIGIDSEDVPHIFDAFYRGRAATDAQIHGTGLGLSLAKSFVEAAGGSISVKTAPGEGSVFNLKLPAAKPALNPQPKALTERTI